MIKLDISFATDSNLFSKVVEELRREKVPLLDVNIRARYMQYKDGTTVEEVPPAQPEGGDDAVVVAPVAKKAPKKK